MGKSKAYTEEGGRSFGMMAQKPPSDIEMVSSALFTLLQFSEKVTKAHISKRGGVVWTPNDQIAHMHCEVSEVFQALRKKEGIEREIHESIDVIMSCLTYFSIRWRHCNHSAESFNGIVAEEIADVVEKLLNRSGLSQKNDTQQRMA